MKNKMCECNMDLQMTFNLNYTILGNGKKSLIILTLGKEQRKQYDSFFKFSFQLIFIYFFYFIFAL